MTTATFEMDNYMPDWTDDFDFGAFLNFPPNDDNQGREDGVVSRLGTVDSNLLHSNRLMHSSAAWGPGGSGPAAELIPDICDERRINVPGPSYIPALLGSSETSETPQSTNTQLHTNSALPGIGYGADNLYGYENGAGGYLQPVYATGLKMTGSETIAMGDHGEACTIPSAQELSRSFAPGLANDSAPQRNCTCLSCLGVSDYGSRYYYPRNSRYLCNFPSCQKEVPTYGERAFSDLWVHEQGHYGEPGNYTCLEQDCHVVTKSFRDLKRHYKTKHCTSFNKNQFPCPILWCKYSGNNGFARKDKLKSHYKNIHEGKSGPGKANRVLKPATLKPQVSISGGTTGVQKE